MARLNKWKSQLSKFQQETRSLKLGTGKLFSSLTQCDSLVNVTDELLRNSKKFISGFNKVMEFVRIEHIIFEESDY